MEDHPIIENIKNVLVEVNNGDLVTVEKFKDMFYRISKAFYISFIDFDFMMLVFGLAFYFLFTKNDNQAFSIFMTVGLVIVAPTYFYIPITILKASKEINKIMESRWFVQLSKIVFLAKYTMKILYLSVATTDALVLYLIYLLDVWNEPIIYASLLLIIFGLPFVFFVIRREVEREGVAIVKKYGVNSEYAMEKISQTLDVKNKNISKYGSGIWILNLTDKNIRIILFSDTKDKSSTLVIVKGIRKDNLIDIANIAKEIEKSLK